MTQHPRKLFFGQGLDGEGNHLYKGRIMIIPSYWKTLPARLLGSVKNLAMPVILLLKKFMHEFIMTDIANQVLIKKHSAHSSGSHFAH